MSSRNPLALSVHGLAKTYRIREAAQQADTLVEMMTNRLRHPLRRPARQEFLALTDVTFSVDTGEAVGIIGRNGAGKSTLLKILSRVTEPTAGTVDLYGKVGSLLEVGTGFHPELTGRENIFLNGAILGMKRRNVQAHFDSIVDFAEIGPFLDTPVKRYSSGMYVRLAFAVAAHLDPEILIVDEVLAVGDAHFQKKCLAKIADVTAEDGRAVLFVSHNMSAVESICGRCIVLHEGRVVFDGDPVRAIEWYLSMVETSQAIDVGVFDLAHADDSRATGTSDRPIMRRLQVCTEDGAAGDVIMFGEGLRLVIDVDDLSVARMLTVNVSTEEGVLVFGVHNQLLPFDIHVDNGRAEQVVVDLPELALLPGRYSIELVVSEGRKGNTVVETVPRAGTFEVRHSEVMSTGVEVARGPRYGVVLLDHRWEMRRNGNILASTATSLARRRPPVTSV